MKALVAGIAAGLAAGACSAPGPYEIDEREGLTPCDVLECPEPGTERPSLTPHEIVVPDAAAMPDGVVSQVSHNNLDIAWHQNRLFFAFRTAPTHFASPDTVMYVVSTTDQKTWVLETEIAINTDVREPRFLAHDGRLFLYYAELGKAALAFDPQGSWVTEYLGPGQWSEPEPVLEPGFIPWRTKSRDGVAYMTAYVGGAQIYEGTEKTEGLQVHWLTTGDGRTFAPAAGDGVVLEGGTSETAFEFAADGAIIAVARNEAGDADGWGSKICRGEPGALGEWTCRADPKKYDSPIMFRHGDDLYLIGRRQVTETGNFDLGMRDLPHDEQSRIYNSEYWVTPKRCSLWKVDPTALEVSFVLDLPSAGDTCFAGVVKLSDEQVLVYNYSSSLADPDIRWIDGQTDPTFIYRVVLSL